MSSRTRSALLVAVALAAGCEQTKRPDPVSQEDAPGKAVEVLCPLVDECECPWSEGCDSEVSRAMQNFLDAGVEAKLKYDAQCMGDLLSQVDELGCDWGSDGRCLCRPFYGWKGPYASCTVFWRPIVLGVELRLDTCGAAYVCEQGRCVLSCGEPEGAEGLGDRGEACSAFSQCESGYCPNGTCQPFPALGEPCIGWCGDGHVCMEQVCQPGVCSDLSP